MTEILTPLINLFEFLRKLFSKDKHVEKEKDRLVFERLNNVVNEQEITDFLSYLYNNSCYDDSKRKNVRKLLYSLDTIENSFLSKGINTYRIKLINNLNSLMEYLSNNFFVIGRDLNLLGLYPDLKNSLNDDENAFYEQEKKKLREVIENTERAYASFRKQVKKELYI